MGRWFIPRKPACEQPGRAGGRAGSREEVQRLATLIFISQTGPAEAGPSAQLLAAWSAGQCFAGRGGGVGTASFQSGSAVKPRKPHSYQPPIPGTQPAEPKQPVAPPPTPHCGQAPLKPTLRRQHDFNQRAGLGQAGRWVLPTGSSLIPPSYPHLQP